MMEPFGPRQIAPSGPAASLPAMQAGEKIVHRPERKVLPTEKVERTAQTGPRPAFQHTYLEQLAAFWPQEPDPPVTQVAHKDPGRDMPPEDPSARAPEPTGERTLTLPADAAKPTVDIRR
jgi:hypothetical protein